MNRTLPPLALGLVLYPLLMLGGCDQQSGTQAGPTASGEILPGTVSDAMLNTDRSQAEPPLAPAAQSSINGSGSATAASASEAAADASSGAEGVPVTEPAGQAKSQSGPAPKPKPAASPNPPAT
jgi:hypothetical protein